MDLFSLLKKHAVSLDPLFQPKGSVDRCMALASTLAMARALYKPPFPQWPTDAVRVAGRTGTGIREFSCQAMHLQLLGGEDVQVIVHSTEW